MSDILAHRDDNRGRDIAVPQIKEPTLEIRSYWTSIRRRFFRHRAGVVCLIVLLLLFLGAIFAEVITPYNAFDINVRAVNQPPSSIHLLGTDDLGRDEFTRILLGGRVSLTVGLLAVLIALGVGTTLGSLAGYYGATLDNLLMRLTDVMISFPSLILMMIFAALLGKGIPTIALVIGMTSWMTVARLVRASFLSLKQQDFTIAAISVGAPPSRIIVRHILPNALGPIIVAATLGVADAIVAESGLSYLGLGIQVPIPSWGGMLNLAQNQIELAPWLSIFPGAMIFIAVLSINFIGDALRDALDPRHLVR
jgi:peptide/nickel transport system permease protein